MTLARILTGTTTALFLATGALAQSETTPSYDESDASTVLATVNGTDITLGHVISLASRLPDQYQSMPDADLLQGILDQLVQQTALSSGMDRDSRAVQLAIENEVRALLASESIKQIESAEIPEEDLAARYEETVAAAPATMEWKSQHILVETEEEAKAIVAELEGGADFGEVAMAKSTGPSGPNGGDLGWQGKGRLVPAFEEAMIALEPGQISAPVQTQFGWHVIKLNEVRETPKPTFEQMRDTIAQGMRDEAVRAELERSAAEAEITRSDIKIDPALIRNTDLLD